MRLKSNHKPVLYGYNPVLVGLKKVLYRSKYFFKGIVGVVELQERKFFIAYLVKLPPDAGKKNVPHALLLGKRNLHILYLDLQTSTLNMGLKKMWFLLKMKVKLLAFEKIRV